MKDKNLVFSIDNKDYYKYDNLEYIIECFKENLKLKEIYIGEKIEMYHKDIINESHIIFLQNILEDKAMEISEYGDTYLNDLKEIKRKELQEVIINWMNENIKQPQSL